MEKEFLSIKEVAEYLGVKPCTVYAWAEARMLPHYKFGRFVRFKKSEIDLWIKENKREGLPSRNCVQRFIKKRRNNTDITEIIRKSIDKSKQERYNDSHGKPDQVKGLGREVS